MNMAHKILRSVERIHCQRISLVHRAAKGRSLFLIFAFFFLVFFLKSDYSRAKKEIIQISV